MTSLSDPLAQGSAHAWLFIPSAILLGALHGLEPGHSKTMMAAFIVAVRGTVKQAILLGLAATVSHTAIVWFVALGGAYLFEGLSPEKSEPYLQFASGLLILIIAAWMLWRTRREQMHAHGHHHDDDMDRALDVADGGYQDAHERQHAEDIRRRFAGREVTTA